MNILVTGATGNVGVPLVQELSGLVDDSGISVIAGVRDVEKARRLFPGLKDLRYREFDLERASSFGAALEGVDLVFLLRPPHISKVEPCFRPLFDEMRKRGIGKVVFLSVQGAERSDIIPHRKIEKMIQAYGFDHVFVRPSYFMQNLTTTLLDDMRRKKAIILPAKNALFNWIDIGNISEACARYIAEFERYKNNAFVLTGEENYDFGRVAEMINEVAHAGIRYEPASPVRFILIKLREHMPLGMIVVMLLLHLLPRYQEPPEVTGTYHDLFGRSPRRLADFLRENADLLRGGA